MKLEFLVEYTVVRDASLHARRRPPALDCVGPPADVAVTEPAQASTPDSRSLLISSAE